MNGEIDVGKLISPQYVLNNKKTCVRQQTPLLPVHDFPCRNIDEKVQFFSSARIICPALSIPLCTMGSYLVRGVCDA